eukprot:5247690-Alexandrium_andersonii.AAC.1
MLRPVSLDMSLDDLIEADKQRNGVGGGGDGASSSPPPANKTANGNETASAKKSNRPGQRAR